MGTDTALPNNKRLFGRDGKMVLLTLSIIAIHMAYSEPTESPVYSLNGREDYEIIKFEKRLDTLSVTSTAIFLFYPLGKFFSKNTFWLNLKRVGFIGLDSVPFDTQGDIVHIASRQTDTIKYFQVDRVGDTAVEIISAKWKLPMLQLENGIVVGTSKSKVFDTFLSNAKPKYLKDIRVLEMVSGLTGIWHYYTFSGGKLTNIEIKSNYMLVLEQ